MRKTPFIVKQTVIAYFQKYINLIVIIVKQVCMEICVLFIIPDVFSDL